MKNKRLRKATNDFQRLMKQRLTDKEDDGFAGWDDDRFPVLERAKRKLRARPYWLIDLVDVANFCMMMWYRRVKANGKASAER